MVKFPLRMSGHIVGDGVIHMTDSHFAGVFSDLDNDDWIAVYMTPDGFTRYSAKAEPDQFKLVLRTIYESEYKNSGDEQIIPFWLRIATIGM